MSRKSVHSSCTNWKDLRDLLELFVREANYKERTDLYAFIARKLLLRARPGLKVRS